MAVASGPSLAQGAETRNPEPAMVSRTTVPAAGSGEALLTVQQPGRFSIRAESATGVALKLLDMVQGPSDPAGEKGVWVGRGDAGTMHDLTGARTAAALARSVLFRLHGALPEDLEDTGFPAPRGYRSVELCVDGGRRGSESCGQTIAEWIPDNEDPPPAAPVALRGKPDHARLIVPMPALYRGWQQENHYPVEERPDAVPDRVRISITSPEQNSRIWRNPEAPKGLDGIRLKVTTEPPVPQVVWYVDGKPFTVADPDKPVFWPLSPGEHHFEARLPFLAERSAPVRIVVE